MCRMMAAPTGIPGHLVADPFLRMARGENALNERNTRRGLVRHGDGWGAVIVRDGETSRVRGSLACWDDEGFSTVRSSVVQLLHARLASSAGRGVDNAHPFVAEVRGETWYFSHNGTLNDEPDDGTGATDSERFFRRMTPVLDQSDPIDAFEATAGALSSITALNALLLSPRGLWAFCVWADSEYAAYYTLAWAKAADGVVVASEPLGDVASRWTPMENRTALWVPAGTADARVVRLRLPNAIMRAAA